MLRKRTRSVQKDQNKMKQLNVPCSGSEFHPKCSSLFKRCQLFTGLSSKVSPDPDSVNSPTSPLDFWVSSSLGNPLRSPRSSNDGHRRNWDSSKVGLGIIDSLDDDGKLSGTVLRSSDSKTVLFGPRMETKAPNCQSHLDFFQGPKSLPKNYAIFPPSKIKSPLQQGTSNVIFEIGETPLESESLGKKYSSSFDSSRSLSRLSGLTNHSPNRTSENISSANKNTTVVTSLELVEESQESEKCSLAKPSSVSLTIPCDNGFMRPLSASEIELSEDYTCVISHGPNPKTTHFYGDCILECHSNNLSTSSENKMKEIVLPQPVRSLDISTSYSSSDFLSFCHSCHKKLEEGKDIYIYRGEKAFCSLMCRSEEILMDEELEKSTEKASESSPKSNSDHEDLFGTSIGGFA